MHLSGEKDVSKVLHPANTCTAFRGIKPLSSALSQALELRLNLTGSVGPNMVIPDQPGQGSWKERVAEGN